MESLEGRALLALSATGTISSAAVGANFAYTIQLTNNGTVPIQTFWYAWIEFQSEDFLATRPVSTPAPNGNWTATVTNNTNNGPGDGYAIEYIASSPSTGLQPGQSLDFSFVTADNPTSVNGNNTFYPDKLPVGTSVVYSGMAFSRPMDQFTVEPASPPLVTVTNVQNVVKHGSVSQIDVFFSGPVNGGDAGNAGLYSLVAAGKKGLFTARNARHLKLKSASYNEALNEVILTPSKRFTLGKNVELTVNGSGLHDSSGRLIDGGNMGMAGSSAVAILSRRGITLE
jgi:hypothetical protein